MNQITKEHYFNKLKQLFPADDFTIIDFINAKSPVTIQCNQCKQKFYYKRGTTLYTSKRKHLCPLCNFQSVIKLRQACKEQDINIIKMEYNVTSLWDLHCNKCDYDFKRAPSSWLKLACPKCGSSHNCYSKAERQVMVDEKFGAGEFEVMSEGPATRNFVIKHKCGLIRKTQFHAFINSSGCPKCMKTISNGEEKILQYLEKNNIQYCFQEKMGDTKQSFDFYLPNFNIAIEYNGQQHYMPIEIFGGNERFKQQLQYDANKVLYCNKNNIHLEIISYLDFNNIDKILDDLFKKFNDQSKDVEED